MKAYRVYDVNGEVATIFFAENAGSAISVRQKSFAVGIKNKEECS